MSTGIKKREYAKKLFTNLDNYHKALLVKCDGVGSKQFQKIRRNIRSDSIILLGKNTLIKRSLRIYLDQGRCNAKIWEGIVCHLFGNIGIVFTRGNLDDLHKKISSFKVSAPARVGVIAPVDVLVPAGSTGMDPAATSFYQALNIPTKINKGNVEIISDMTVIKSGDRVGSSEAALLTKLGIKPFSYGLQTIKVFEDGSIYEPTILELSDSDFDESVCRVLYNITAFSIELGVPNLAAIPYLMNEGYRNVRAIAISSEFNIS